MSAPLTSDTDTRGASVLVVEDQAEVRVLLNQLLTRMECQVFEAPDGDTAAEMVREQAFDLILLDLTLPDTNGMVVFDLIRAYPHLRNTPVVFLTGENAAPVKARAYEQGAADYITKPFSLVELQARLKAHIRQKREHDQERTDAEQVASKAFHAQQAAERRFTSLVQNSFDLICELDPNLLVEYASPNHRDVLGLDQVELNKEPWLVRVHPDDRLDVADTLGQMMISPTPVRITTRFRDAHREYRYLDVSGSRLHGGEENEAPRLLIVSRDITESKNAELKLMRMAMEDPLTEISNRQHFSLELNRILELTHDSRGESLMFIDLDNFKVINDTRGHPAGDLVLQTIARELRRICRSNDLVARVGGDEFCLLMRDIHPDTAVRRAQQIVTNFQQHPIRYQGEVINISVSLGVANITKGMTAEEAISRADTALYAAKASGKGRARVYTPDSDDLSSLRTASAWCERIKEAISTGRFQIYYQPIVELCSGRIARHEALIRYREDDGSILGPSVFLPAARRFKMMPAIDQHVLSRVAADLIAHPTLEASVNISGSTFNDPGFFQLLQELQKTHGFLPSRMTLEITETEYMEDLVRARETTFALRKEGYRLALDDFGAGFSSMSYLRNLPVDYVKIDGSFVENVANDPVDLALLRSIKEIAHLLGKKTVAEFVSSQPLAELLMEEGIDFGQGFALGKPAPLVNPRPIENATA